MRLRFLARVLAPVTVVAGALLFSAPAALAGPEDYFTNNGDGTVTLSYATEGSKSLWICDGSVAAADCTYATRMTNAMFTLNGFTFSPSPWLISEETVLVRLINGGSEGLQPVGAGCYTLVYTESPGTVPVASIVDVAIGDASGCSNQPGADTSAEAPAPKPATRTIGIDGAAGCSKQVSGSEGSWVQLPSAKDCDADGRTLVGWSSSPDFPVKVAQAQIDKRWGAIDDTIDGVRMIFIPAGGWTFLSGDNALYPVWSAAA